MDGVFPVNLKYMRFFLLKVNKTFTFDCVSCFIWQVFLLIVNIKFTFGCISVFILLVLQLAGGGRAMRPCRMSFLFRDLCPNGRLVLRE